MASLSEQLSRINKAYFDCLDLKKLHSESECLNAIIDNPNLFDDKRDNAKALRLRLNAKLRLLAYADGFAEENYVAAKQYFEQAIAEANQNGYGKTAAIVEKFAKFATDLNAALGETVKYRRVFGGAVTDVDLCTQALSCAARSRELLKECNFVTDVPLLQLGDLKQRAAEYLDDCEKLFQTAKQRVIVQTANAYIKDITYYRRDYEVFPMPEYTEGGKANAVVLSTPLTDDARLFAAYQCGDDGKLLCVEASGLADKEEDFLQTLFGYICEQNAVCIVENALSLPVEKCDALLMLAMRLGKRGLKIYLTDTSGTAHLNKRAMELAGEEGDDVSIADISLEYISMPVYASAKEELIARKIVNEVNGDEILQSMPFLGFCGFSQLLKLHGAGDARWQDKCRRISNAHSKAVLNYLEHLSAVYLVIDSGWGDFSQYEKQRSVYGGFNYDLIRDIDRNNIRLIVDSNESVFAKCGMIARYCTLGTDDKSVWQRLERDEMENRLRQAVRSVYQILRLPVSENFPKVELLDELENQTAGGLCCDGGKCIQFKLSCTLNIDWTFGTIVHESFHSLQSALVNGAWTDWHFLNMGISRGRVMLWKETRQIYNGNTHSNVYKVHMYEADARAFEYDCDEARTRSWNSMNFN